MEHSFKHKRKMKQLNNDKIKIIIIIKDSFCCLFLTFARKTFKTCIMQLTTRHLPFSTETRTIGLNSLKESQQNSARDLPPNSFSSGRIKKLAKRSSSVTKRSSINVKLPTPAKTIFLQNCKNDKRL